VLKLRYEASGDIRNLDEAIDCGEEAVARIPPNALQSALRMVNLSNAYDARHERFGSAADLDKAFRLIQAGLAGLPAGHPGEPGARANYSRLSQELYRVSGKVSYLDMAISAARGAAERAGRENPRWPRLMSTLAGQLRDRHNATAEPADLDEAIEIGRQAATASTGSPDDLKNLCDFGDNLRLRFERNGQPGDLAQALDVLSAVARDVPGQHPVRESYLEALGMALRARAASTCAEEDRLAATEVLLDAARQSASPLRKIDVYNVAGNYCASVGDWARAADILAEGVGVIPLATTWELPLADQVRLAREYSALTAVAAGRAIKARNLEQAVRVLETGRATAFSRILGSRADLAPVRAMAPPLADRLERARQQVASLEGGDLSEGRRHADEYDTALAEIRQLPGMESFGAVASSAEVLSAAAGNGPVVILTACRGDDCAALVLRPDRVEHVPLPVTWDELATRGIAMADAVELATGQEHERAGPLDGESRIAEVLAWLWENLTAPVFSHLGYAPDPEAVPRVWWMPTGIFSAFPLHAAGNARESALSWATSSYIPTLAALRHARARDLPADGETLIVSISRTPGQGPLRFARAEADDVQRAFPGAIRLDNEMATARAVLAALPDAAVAHFSCHASADLHDPGRADRRLRATRGSAYLGCSGRAGRPVLYPGEVPEHRSGSGVGFCFCARSVSAAL
jgi:tetratricopeptide (TPR) repeat protein